MQDVEYVKFILDQEYATELADEQPYPELDDVILSTEFDYLKGTIEGEEPNGSKSREGRDYLWFHLPNKSVLSHRFIAAVTLGKWPPREFDVDHVNHDPSDNRPSNLRVVTRRDNAGSRRRALLSELADLATVSQQIIDRKKAHALEVQRKERQRLDREREAAAKKLVEAPPPPRIDVKPVIRQRDPFADLRPSGPIPALRYTGEIMPGVHSGTYYGTSLGSWHWYPDGEKPDSIPD